MMKRSLIFAFLLIATFSKLIAQTDPFTEKEIIWYGIDFSAAKLIGSHGFTNITEIKSKLFDAWNDIILIENNKYSIEKYFIKQKVFNDLSIVEKRNTKISTEGMVIDAPYSFEKDKVIEMVKSYQTEQNYGVGLVFIVESLDKIKGNSFVYVTFFDVKTKEVLYAEKVIGEPSGLTFKNFWAGSFLSVMNRSNWKLGKWHKKFKQAKKTAK